MSGPHLGPDAEEASEHACGSCSIGVNRRGFLRAAALAAAAALVVSGEPSEAFAQPLAINDLQPLLSAKDSKTYAIPAADGVSIDKSADVILVRWEHNVYAFNLSCPHQNTALRWLESDHRFQCPKHKSKYRPDGAFIEGRATRGMDRLEIKREGTNVVVNLDRMFKQDDDAAGWTAAVVHVD
ncbi:MAG: Rieske (2Fe-2S) protein [Gemmatimonadaceae bacterium]